MAAMSPELMADGLKADAMRFALCHFSSARICVNLRLISFDALRYALSALLYFSLRESAIKYLKEKL